MKNKILIKQIREIRKSYFSKKEQDNLLKMVFISIEKSHEGTRESAKLCT